MPKIIEAPNRIVLISRGRHEEAPANITVYPGMLASKDPNNNLMPHNIYGGRGPVYVIEEDAWRGLTINQPLVSPAGDGTFQVAPYRVAAKGDKLLMLLQKGQNVTAQTMMMSGGDGTIVADPNGPLYAISTPSTVVTNTTVATTFSNGSFSVPANSLVVGSVLQISGQGTVLSQHAADTHEIKVLLGAGPTTLLDFTALPLATGNIFGFALSFSVTDVGATGHIVGKGTYWYGNPLSPTEAAFTLASTAVDTTVGELVAIQTTASAANTLNQIQLNQFRVELDVPGGFQDLVLTDEAINNTSGTGTSGFNGGAFVRCIVL